ncbi:HNH endonuclease signature motif containing protein [Cellulomonas edaphi]|uniref:HNH endonuclease signature motif containing protein n=1 Tax=Cellulomonas edaphi TaxID=3053468 RepID=A0ABT7S892_9CELL|nr:HNH endonuclease signature motif containing protein [Cellulomons edaphi]MDM7831827.1 HNH endonuclease signature motif containing protein [Cellulomons edaphi]
MERFAVAQILGAGTVPASVLARLACDSELTRVVFGARSQVIDVGRAERTFTGPRRRAVIARDQTCRYPTCTAPPALGEVHHVEHWARGGSTDANTGILLCRYHHDVVHRSRIEIGRSPTGGWTFTARDGAMLPRAA